MKFLVNLRKNSVAADLVKQGLANAQSVSTRRIRDCILLLANGLGETWKSASKEAAAGMALVALAKNAELGSFLNSRGWKLVISFITANPEIARNISPRTLGEIFAHQQNRHATAAAWA